MYIFSLLNAFIFILISFIHFYWAFGGKWAVDYVVPISESQSGKALFKPGFIVTLMVAVALLFFAYVNLEAIYHFGWFPYYNLGLLIISLIFLIRAIGEFKYIGFFKKINGTKFSVNDSKYYSPLCVIISVNSLITLYLNIN